MFTATADRILPTTVTGSWPRPAWYTEALRGTPFTTKMNEIAFREQFSDAVAALISDQEHAGLDVLTNGDFHQDPDLGGRSWFLYPWERLSGVAAEATSRPPGQDDLSVGEHTLIGDLWNAWRFPAIVSKVEDAPRLEYADIWSSAQSRAAHPVKFGSISAQLVATMAEDRSGAYKPDKSDLMWRLSEVFNGELRKLADAGCKVIQIEEPLIHTVAAMPDSDPGFLRYLVECLNREIQGLDDVEVWIHTCWGNPNMQRISRATRYDGSLPYYMEQVNADVWTVESKDNPYPVVELFDAYAHDGWPEDKKVAVGVVSHRALQVETVEEVASGIRAALEHIPLERLVLSTDCGFGRQGVNRPVAFFKAVTMAQAANSVRREHGLPETPIPALDGKHAGFVSA